MVGVQVAPAHPIFTPKLAKEGMLVQQPFFTAMGESIDDADKFPRSASKPSTTSCLRSTSTSGTVW
jgi:hypothetical protein